MAELTRTTGQQVFQGNMRYSLTQAFGPDASLKAQAYLGVSHLHLHCMLLMKSQLVKSVTVAASSKCIQCMEAKARIICVCIKLVCVVPDLPDHKCIVDMYMSFQFRNVYFSSEKSSLHWNSQIGNVWGQYNRISTLWTCTGAASIACCGV